MSLPKIAIIGGSKDAIDLALALDRADVCLFSTQSYPTPKGICTRPYNDKALWKAELTEYDAVIAAPHPFAFPRLEAVKHVGIPTLALHRPEWTAGSLDNWKTVDDTHAATLALQQSGAQKPLLTLGRERLAAFIAMEAPQLIVRCRTKPGPDIGPRGEVVYQPGPFTVQQEVEYLCETGVDCIIVHNAGGQGGWPKLQAARELNIPVILIKRPAINWPHEAQDVAGALNWLRQSVGLDV